MDLKIKIPNMRTLLDRNIDYRPESYKFYVPPLRDKPAQLDACLKRLQPTLLGGEIVIAEAHSAAMHLNVIEKNKHLVGDLFVTNFRIFFSPYEDSLQKEAVSQRNNLIGEYATCLSNVDAVFHVDGDKTRRLLSNSGTVRPIKAVQIVCKNLRVFSFSFEHCPCDHYKNVANTILHHAFPGRHSLLFAYEYSGPETSDDIIDDVIMFNEKDDWRNELKRNYPDNGKKWHFTELNRGHALTRFLPEWVIVPKNIFDNDLQLVCNAFRYSRLPTWTWSYRNGAALVRLSLLLPGVPERTQENKILEKIRSSHPSCTPPEIVELEKYLPSIKDISISYSKLRELFTPDAKRLKEQESKFYPLLESCKWLLYVSTCLREAVKCGKLIQSGITVVLQEGEGRDTSAIIASLIQLMMDPPSRTISGFQSLIQKEWVALGHPFATRLGHVQSVGPEHERSPVFLLFLDCVWQLQNQYPTHFEFTETYLTTLFDSCFVSLFETFLFDSERERLDAARSGDAKFRRFSVWNWKRQFSNSDIALFYNPLYLLEDLPSPEKQPNMPLPTIFPKCSVPFLEPWAQCYYRWHPSLGIRGGGRPLVDLTHRRLRKAVDSLKNLTSSTLDDFQRVSIANFFMDKRKSLSVGSLLERTQIPDNFFPFSAAAESTANIMSDSSAFAEFDRQSVLNYSE